MDSFLQNNRKEEIISFLQVGEIDRLDRQMSEVCYRLRIVLCFIKSYLEL